jgi:hypothetical protein
MTTHLKTRHLSIYDDTLDLEVLSAQLHIVAAVEENENYVIGSVEKNPLYVNSLRNRDRTFFDYHEGQEMNELDFVADVDTWNRRYGNNAISAKIDNVVIASDDSVSSSSAPSVSSSSSVSASASSSSMSVHPLGVKKNNKNLFKKIKK